MRPSPQYRGHLAVCLVKDGEKHYKHVHRLVLETFVGPCPPGLICCHNDGNPANNRVENLRWDTHKSNSHDMLRHGTRLMGSRASAKLREEDVLEIRRMRAEGVPMNDLAIRFGVGRPNIEAIIYRRSWKHLP